MTSFLVPAPQILKQKIYMKDSKFLIIPMILSDSPTYTALVYTPFSILFSQKITLIKDIFMQPSNLHLLVALICQEPLNVEGPKS